MGLAHTMVAFSFVLAGVVSLGIAVPAAMDAEESWRERREEARALEELREGTEISTSQALYDVLTSTLVVVVSNTGTSALHLDDQVFLVDGVAYHPASAVTEGESEVWFPGENATFTLTGVTGLPARLLLVGPTRAAASLATSADGVVDTYPVGFELGAGAANSRYVSNVQLSTDRSAFTATAKLKNGAEMVVGDVLRIRNPHTAAHTVQLTATQDTNVYVEQMTWIVKSGGAEVGRLNFKSANPALTFTLASGARYTMDLWADLKEGSGDHNANGDFALTMVVT